MDHQIVSYNPDIKKTKLKILFIVVFLGFLLGLSAQSPPACTMLTTPSNGETGVSVNTQLQWQAVANATQYFLFIGTSPGGTDIVNGVSMGNNLGFTPTTSLLPNTVYYVKVIPNNNNGDAQNCIEESFTTGLASSIPGCVTLSIPAAGSYGVPPDTNISWIGQSEAIGYILNIGTIAGVSDILSNEDVGNVTTYDPPADLPLSQRVYITIIPYNSTGESPSCSEVNFRTRGNNPPLCTEIIDPMDGGEFVSVTANITWIRDFNASGYLMTIEKSSIGGIKILDNFDVGNGTNFKPPDFEGNTLYFVRITPYNDLGSAPNCQPISFTTGTGPVPPECTNLLNPKNGSDNINLNSNLEWEPVNGILGYILSVGTSSGGTDLVNELDLGNTTNYSFQQPLPESSSIYVTITPYSINLLAENCREESFTTAGFQLTPEELPVPKFFTPNNDGFNDLWIVNSTSEIQVNTVHIFNRYGQLLKQLFADQGWDGSFNGKPLASDSYWYRIETTRGNSQVGFFMLKR
ncbi:T9SS type B sorting domain-containing protein [Eudoraea sp.]|uniref:T9SS type B sorting domain-containing protein n=2 Tax=Eudoraea sp. TaxID=1979955 RepID=UPI003C7333C5